jgi:hypothetical protein
VGQEHGLQHKNSRFDEIQRSNMSKLDHSGNSYTARRESIENLFLNRLKYE